MSITIDAEAIGWADDGTEQGYIGTAAAVAGLVPMPWDRYRVENVNGSASWAVGASSAHNDDGSATAWVFNVAQMSGSPPTTGTFRLRHIFRGRRYGIRYDPTYTYLSGAIADFCVMIDGVCYRVPKARSHWDDASTSLSPGVAYWGCPVILPDGEHQADIIAVGSQTAAIGQMIFGFLGDPLAGYTMPPRSCYPAAMGAVPTTAAPFSAAWSNNTARVPRGLVRLVYMSTDASPRTVTISMSGSTLDTITVPAGGRAEWPTVAGSPVALDDANLKHKIDSGATVTCTAYLQG